MTMRERMLAVIRGREHDRVPFVQYHWMVPADDARALVGRGNIGELSWCPAATCEMPNSSEETEEFELDGRRARRTTLHTPEGDLQQVWVDADVAAHLHEHYVKEPSDYRALMAYLRDHQFTANIDGWTSMWGQLGDDGICHTCVSRTAYQSLWIMWVSPVNLIAHMTDEPALMEEVFTTFNDLLEQEFACACELARQRPVPYIVMPDNITAPMIGETYFRKYCMPMYARLREMLDEAGSDIPVAVHADGDLKPLWDAFGESAVRWIDSMSPTPDNDTSVADALQVWPETGIGINFPSSVHIQDAESIYRATLEILEQGGRSRRLQIQISEDMPPEAWRKSYPQIVRGIEDFYG
ncbi:MAG: uroporphyrinogen decarboxylase family protein [Planctomycetota bacterium]|jgi:hypothetical protein